MPHVGSSLEMMGGFWESTEYYHVFVFSVRSTKYILRRSPRTISLCYHGAAGDSTNLNFDGTNTPALHIAQPSRAGALADGTVQYGLL
jgi:hypothetical protein